MEYIKSPLNYVGGKYKLLNQIIPLLPNDINKFIDLFGGGFNVGINVDAKSIYYNDICKQVVDLLIYLNENETNKSLKQVKEIIDKYKLSKENKDGFLQLRDYYNNDCDSPIVFYTMICYAFNYQIRFNKQGKYNMPFGKDRSSFNPSLEQKFVKFCDELHNKKCHFSNYSFYSLDVNSLKENDFLYIDPPYLNSDASYNEQDGWNIEDEKKLLNMLDRVDSLGVKFALSNNLKYDNDLLSDWCEKYNVHYLNIDYSNCNYQKKDRGKDIEVLVTNY